MKIAIDARGINWYRGTGIGTYTENVVKNLINIYDDTYFHLYWSEQNYEYFKKKNTELILTSKKHPRFFEQNYFYNDLNRNEIDIYHVPQNGIGIDINIKCKKVITVHDLIPYIMPETVGKGYLLKFLKEIPSIIQNADGILTVSEYSKKDILKFFPIDPNRIFVTPLAADKIYKPLEKGICKSLLKEKYNINNPFILYLGGFSARKNVSALINSFLKVHSSLHTDYNLVIVGAQKDLGEYLSNKYSNLRSKIIFTGFIPQEELPIFYNSCDVFVYPSLYEGFGLPPLEAMSCGTPVITSNTTSIPEVVGDSGLLINPYDEDELTTCLEKLLNNESLRKSLSIKSLKQSSKFSWYKTATKTFESYKTIYEL
ncbi:glycosyltransferase family 4 protein [Clostridium botulinum]|uniref:Glycosyl transferase n=1 Tax=Clostridium botulinum TaxID=1491 RepID=A0A9Q1ZE36_CLOBO|nr:glycosyltransferase family 1 protein [Clostridium botulinum]AEB76986.1 mannosyltransferase, putative [Clostridium botulinum BKT015925]KEH98419.1 glycosyl transferase [Clostridium botulinum D str. 16868]KEI05160.1 glycosyl transferase [Clostridium botulinum C/D str. Sp77]KLU75432.1 glycosyl transferase [Clostridium botulinum V891]KOA76288.1 glycosyl transferase [Clostridium botulinum]